MDSTPCIAFRGPEMLRRVGAPGPPALRPCEQRLRRKTTISICNSRTAKQADIAFGERIAVTQRTERPILRGPRTPTGKGKQPRGRLLVAARRLEQPLVPHDGVGK